MRRAGAKGLKRSGDRESYERDIMQTYQEIKASIEPLKSFIGLEVELVTVSENRLKPDLGIRGELGQHSSGRYYVRFAEGKFQFSGISLVAAWEAASGRIVRVRI